MNSWDVKDSLQVPEDVIVKQLNDFTELPR